MGTNKPARLNRMPMMNTPLITLPNRRTIIEKVRVICSNSVSGAMNQLGSAKLLR
jgi:hypothetical protein